MKKLYKKIKIKTSRIRGKYLDKHILYYIRLAQLLKYFSETILFIKLDRSTISLQLTPENLFVCLLSTVELHLVEHNHLKQLLPGKYEGKIPLGCCLKIRACSLPHQL